MNYMPTPTKNESKSTDPVAPVTPVAPAAAPVLTTPVLAAAAAPAPVTPAIDMTSVNVDIETPVRPVFPMFMHRNNAIGDSPDSGISALTSPGDNSPSAGVGAPAPGPN